MKTNLFKIMEYLLTLVNHSETIKYSIIGLFLFIITLFQELDKDNYDGIIELG